MDHLIDLLAPSGPTSPAETYAEHVEYLRELGYNLDRVFSTDEGRQLGIDTSHTLTPAIVGYATDTCGLSFDEAAPE
jgi:hypothetical protein